LQVSLAVRAKGAMMAASRVPPVGSGSDESVTTTKRSFTYSTISARQHIIPQPAKKSPPTVYTTPKA
jgi:hypothetical protein